MEPFLDWFLVVKCRAESILLKMFRIQEFWLLLILIVLNVQSNNFYFQVQQIIWTDLSMNKIRREKIVPRHQTFIP